MPHRDILSLNLMKVDEIVGRKGETRHGLTWYAYNRKSQQIMKNKMLHRWFYSEKLRFKRKNNLKESGIVLFSFLLSIGSMNLF